jgi:hypothetical protein
MDDPTFVLLGSDCVRIFRNDSQGPPAPQHVGLHSAQIDYLYGVVRRGLFGEVCRVLHVPVADYRVFSAIALLLLAGLLTLMFRLMSQIGINDMAEGSLIALIASSFWLAYLVNLVGYFDIILALLAVTVISIRRPWTQALAAIALGSIGVLFHEIYLFALLPVSLLGLVHWSERRKCRLWLPLLCAVVPACVTLGSWGTICVRNRWRHSDSQYMSSPTPG